MIKRIKKKDTALFFDSFKHFKNNFCNLICLELPKLVELQDTKEYFKLKSVNYKSKFPDMRKLGLIDYDKPKDSIFKLTKEGEKIYHIIKKKQEFFHYEESSKKQESIKPDLLFKKLTKNEQKQMKTQLIKLLISYYDTADSIRPYLSLIKMIEKLKIKKLDEKKLCNILAQKKYDILSKKFKKKAFEELDDDIKKELKRPISYIYNGLETAGMIDDQKNIIYDKVFLKNIIAELNKKYKEIELEEEKALRSTTEQRKFRKSVLEAYHYQCAITGESIMIENNKTTTYLLEAAHIIPYSDSGSFSINNGIALSIQMHKLFDRKLFAFQYNEKGQLEVVVTASKKVKDSTGILKRIDHKIISLPTDPLDAPDPDAIQYRLNEYLLT